MNKSTLKRSLLLFLISYSCLQSTSHAQSFNASLRSKKGLFIQQGNLTWGMGSEINFLDADRKHHEYYFTWWEQDVDSSDAEKTILAIGSKNTAVDGELLLQSQLKKAALTLQCNWNKESEGVCDILYLKIWAPFFEQATWISQQGQVLRGPLADFHDSVVVVHTSFGCYKIHATTPFSIKTIATPHPGQTAYATREQYYLLEEKNIKLKKGDQLRRTLWVEEITECKLAPTVATQTVTREKLQQTSTAWEPVAGKMELLPQPVSYKELGGIYPLPLTLSPPTPPQLVAFNRLIKQYWKVPGYLLPALHLKKDSSLATEAYRISISDRIAIRYASPLGLQHALQSIGQLVQQKNGQLFLPQLELEDAPKISWRGIHMFTGPTSWSLHKKMFDQVLMPLKINKTVIQCEQAAWKCFPNVHNPISISLTDLKTEFNYLRSNHIEPIPLIQSLGHMEWFFKPKQNRALAVNPSYPYTLNTTLPQAQQAIQQLWNEAVQLLKPKTIHVGFDEIGMIGFNWPREKEVTLFKDQLQWLHQYSQQKNLSLMIWGDMGLAPGEGPDACNGINPERAAQIRKSIPPKTWVADWHYLGNPDPTVYRNSLSLWKNSGLQPIASPWFLTNNIRGFTLAAIEQNAGVLQTTWADFESSELNVLKNIEQFGAYVAALDYAWSGRKELPAQLPYDPVVEFTTRFYRQPLPLQKRSGLIWTGATQLVNRCDSLFNARPDRFTLSTDTAENIMGWKVLATTAVLLPEATPVASIEFWRNNKLVTEATMLYGRELRAVSDQRPIYKRIPEKEKTAWYNFLTAPLSIDKIIIRTIHPAAGLQVKEVVLIQ